MLLQRLCNCKTVFELNFNPFIGHPISELTDPGDFQTLKVSGAIYKHKQSHFCLPVCFTAKFGSQLSMTQSKQTFLAAIHHLPLGLFSFTEYTSTLLRGRKVKAVQKIVCSIHNTKEHHPLSLSLFQKYTKF